MCLNLCFLKINVIDNYNKAIIKKVNFILLNTKKITTSVKALQILLISTKKIIIGLTACIMHINFF